MGNKLFSEEIEKIKKSFPAFNWFSDIWLLFLFFPLTSAWPYDTFKRLTIFILTIVFIFIFIRIYSSSGFDYDLLVGLLIGTILGIMINGTYMTLYLAWAVGFASSKNWFKFFYTLQVLSSVSIAVSCFSIYKAFSFSD